ncbi:MAG: 2-dehydropantoate 2-reductase [Desulfohalobiaceae bacterium]|nr:2-dehydropantoate 2-reductase [Desulfohalobiaceae bacterium]
MRSTPKVCVVGAGAMGSFYAAKLYERDPESVYLLAGGERFTRLKQHGIVVNDTHYPCAVRRPEDRGEPADLVLVTVKYQHLPQAVLDMANAVGEQTLILSAMNGIDSEEILAGHYGWQRVLYGVALGIDAQRSGNRVSYTKEGVLYWGRADNAQPDPAMDVARRVLDAAGIPNQEPEDMLRMLWWKYMVNCGANQVSAMLKVPYGALQRIEEARLLMESAMAEVVDLASALGVDLRREDMDTWYSVLDSLSPEGRTSMCQDIQAGRKTEVEMFAGKVLELARERGIDVPANRFLFQAVRGLEKWAEMAPGA